MCDKNVLCMYSYTSYHPHPQRFGVLWGRPARVTRATVELQVPGTRLRSYYKNTCVNCELFSTSIVMPIPGEGIESTYKNSVDDVQIFLDTKHPSKFAVVNLSQRPTKLKGKVRNFE